MKLANKAVPSPFSTTRVCDRICFNLTFHIGFVPIGCTLYSRALNPIEYMLPHEATGVVYWIRVVECHFYPTNSRRLLFVVHVARFGNALHLE